MSEPCVAGWDVGGAHLKVAVADSTGRLTMVRQVPCRLWLGLDCLREALAAAGDEALAAGTHAVTMTGELTDLFESRADGVIRLIEALIQALPPARLRVYAGGDGFLSPDEATARPRAVASANWHAGASWAAGRHGDGIFMDIGSTTTDIVPVGGGRVTARGYTDDERLAEEELVYTGLTRTPVFAVARTASFGGRRRRLMAELFATMADVYRLTGELVEDDDQQPAADGGAKTVDGSMRRLARTLGLDAADGSVADWRRYAGDLAEAQLGLIRESFSRIASRPDIADVAPIIGAGAGRFLAARLAARVGRPYVDFATLVDGADETRAAAARCAPAVAVALMAVGP